MCNDCAKDASTCTMCGIQGNLNYDVTNGKCVACPLGAMNCANNKVTKCQGGYYLDKTSKSCKECPSTCIECTSATSCSFCKYGYERTKSGQCFQCPDKAVTCIDKLTCVYGYYPDIGKNSCLKCPAALNCQQCDSSTTCSTCFVGDELTNDLKCVPKSSLSTGRFEAEAASAPTSSASKRLFILPMVFIFICMSGAL